MIPLFSLVFSFHATIIHALYADNTFQDKATCSRDKIKERSHAKMSFIDQYMLLLIRPTAHVASLKLKTILVSAETVIYNLECLVLVLVS